MKENEETRMGMKGGKPCFAQFRDFARAVAVGTGHFVHAGWIRSQPIGFGRDRSCNQAPSRSKSW